MTDGRGDQRRDHRRDECRRRHAVLSRPVGDRSAGGDDGVEPGAGRINDLLNLSPDVITKTVEDLVLLGGDGNDVFDIASDHPYKSIIVTGDGSDAGATADANGDQVLVRGVARGGDDHGEAEPVHRQRDVHHGDGREPGRRAHFDFGRGTDLLLRRTGHAGARDGANDTLVVDPGQGTHTVRVDGGRFSRLAAVMPGPYDRVTSDSLPQVFGGGLDILRVAPAAGAPGNVEVTFVTGDLTRGGEVRSRAGRRRHVGDRRQRRAGRQLHGGQSGAGALPRTRRWRSRTPAVPRR